MTESDIFKYAHGPFSLLERARETAYDLVDPPLTQWSVVELFGPGFDQPERADGEQYGEMWVVPTDRADEFADAKDAEDHQIVDTYGYENETED